MQILANCEWQILSINVKGELFFNLHFEIYFVLLIKSNNTYYLD